LPGAVKLKTSLGETGACGSERSRRPARTIQRRFQRASALILPLALASLAPSASAQAGDNVRAWGYNGEGELGNGTTTDSSTPVAVSGLSNVVAIAGGVEHSLVLLSNGTVMAWGFNGNGELGNGTTTDSSTPVAVGGLAAVSRRLWSAIRRWR
jgi:alpha-tubulin suppressor-like RCC1 family protein